MAVRVMRVVIVAIVELKHALVLMVSGLIGVRANRHINALLHRFATPRLGVLPLQRHVPKEFRRSASRARRGTAATVASKLVWRIVNGENARAEMENQTEVLLRMGEAAVALPRPPVAEAHGC